MKKSALLLVLLVSAVVVTSGCISGFDPEALATANPLISKFLEDHPNAQLSVIHYNAEESANIIDQTRADCEKDWLEPKELYKVTVEDNSSGLLAVVWIDAAQMEIECAVKFSVDVEDGEDEDKDKICIDLCGNGVCDELVCQGTGCPCPETYGTCAEDCAPSQGSWTDEYMCKNNWTYRRYQHSNGNYSWKNYEYCTYGCANGSCNLAPELNQSQSQWLNQYQCQHQWSQRLYQYANGTKQWLNYSYCGYGCSDGQCLNQSEGNESQNEWTNEYRCSDGWMQRKQSQGNGSYQWMNYEYCEYDCSNGTCLEGLDDNETEYNETECAGEGEHFSVVYDDYPGGCCGNLTKWESGMDTDISVGTSCYETMLLAGSPVGICINCGNGVCESIENVCNCPQDCTDAGNSDYQTAGEFCDSNIFSTICSGETNNLTVCDLCAV